MGPAADDEDTDLKMLVEQVQLAAAGLGIGAQPSPWLGPLPRTLLLRDLAVTSAGTTPGRAQALVPFGIIDLPRQQRQETAVLNLDTFGHLLAAGAPRSGRSQLLRTIAAAIAASTSCADAHLFGIDCGNGALLPVAGLPHCGAVVTRTQAERATRLITRLGGDDRGPVAAGRADLGDVRGQARVQAG
jgi:S-DNA-T family DNA segregation ATPase FtsK/SpoIIIE